MYDKPRSLLGQRNDLCQIIKQFTFFTAETHNIHLILYTRRIALSRSMTFKVKQEYTIFV